MLTGRLNLEVDRLQPSVSVLEWQKLILKKDRKNVTFSVWDKEKLR